MGIASEMSDNNKARETSKLIKLFTSHIIAYQDDITLEEAKAFYKHYHAPNHANHPFNNYKACSMCRVSDAEQLAVVLISSIEGSN